MPVPTKTKRLKANAKICAAVLAGSLKSCPEVNLRINLWGKNKCFMLEGSANDLFTRSN